MTKEYMFLVYRWVKSFQNSGSIFNQKIQYSEMRDFLNNDDKEKEDFHENFTLFLHKNRARFLYKYRLKAEQMMCKILDKNDIYIFYYLKHISDFQNK